MALIFSITEVAAKYEPVGEADLEISRGFYHGNLTNIDLVTADAMAESGSQYIKVKVVKAVPAKPAATT